MYYVIHTNGTTIEGLGAEECRGDAVTAAQEDAARNYACETHELDGWTEECTERLYRYVCRFGGHYIGWHTNDDGYADISDDRAEEL